MTITITLEHSDIIGTDSSEIEALFCILQAYAKMTRGTSTDSLAATRKANEEEMKAAKKPVKPAEKKESVEKVAEIKAVENKSESENSFDRTKIETEIKQIALEGKEKGVSKKIKAFIQEYGFEKLNEVPDEKMQELLEKVKSI